MRQLTHDGASHLPAHLPEKFQSMDLSTIRPKLGKQATITDLESTNLNPKVLGRIVLGTPQVKKRVLDRIRCFIIVVFIWYLILFPFFLVEGGGLLVIVKMPREDDGKSSVASSCVHFSRFYSFVFLMLSFPACFLLFDFTSLGILRLTLLIFGFGFAFSTKF